MFGEWMKAQRSARNLTQKQLAELAGTTENYIRHLEKNRHPNPGPAIINGLARAFGISADEVLRHISRPDHPLDPIFPAERLRAEGLPEEEIARLARLWEKAPASRQSLLEGARSFARAYTKYQDLTARLGDEGAHLPDPEPAIRPIAS